MKMAIFSDIHSNLEALTRFFDITSEMNIDRYICLGDIVGYGANPAECIDLVGQAVSNIVFTQGNHDAAVLWNTTPYGMNKVARDSILWTMDQLDEPHMVFLQKMKMSFTMAGMMFCHANPYNPGGWRYVNNRKYASRTFRGCRNSLIFIGHTHTPLYIEKESFFSIRFNSPEKGQRIHVPDGTRLIFNCGSIGQPRTRCPELNFLVYDTRNNTVTFESCSYDHVTAAEKILDAGLPKNLAVRLRKGV